ncbi:MAG: glutaredoxin family protein [Verrucomicrobia bacterium]|nr:glutaredoxin family protein [Verrucomicrobiota bacterium]
MKIDLYVKVWCPWCVKAVEALDALACRYTVHDVEREPGAAAAMHAISGQTRVPTMQVGTDVLSDFGPEEVEPFLLKLGVLRHS